MQFWEFVFLLSCFLVFYNYAGYAILAYVITLVAKKRAVSEINTKNLPTVSFIVAAYNEEDFIEKKIINSLSLEYPESLIEFIFITDGSTDNTNATIGHFPSVKLLYQAERGGKSAALNRAVKAANNDILIFSDANTTLNKDVILNIVKHYQDEKTGGVAGEKKVVNPSDKPDEVGTGEGLYWKYESLLKRIDSKFYSVVGAAGELFSIRRSLYEPVPHNLILDDFIISLKVAQKGYRIIYEPDAYAAELPSFSIRDEQKRKIRIAAGGFQAIGMLTGLFKFWKYPRLSFLYISHRLMRWTVSPLCLIFAFISNMILFIQSGNSVYKITFMLQLAFYLMAVAGTAGILRRFKLLKLPYYFTFMNVSVIQGFFRHLKGGQSAIWEKAKRSSGLAHTQQANNN